MSFLYSVGDHVMVATWRSRARNGANIPIEAEVLDRASQPPGHLFPHYRVLIRMARGKTVEGWLTEHEVLGLAREHSSPTHRYYQVVAHESLLTYFRVPLPAPPRCWKALLAVMKACGVKRKDIIEITHTDGTENSDEAKFVKRLRRAYEGDRDVVPTAAFYDWVGADWVDDGFALVRAAVR